MSVRERVRAEFRSSVEHELGARGLQLVGLTLGRAPGGAAIWSVTVVDGGVLWTNRIPVERDVDPYAMGVEAFVDVFRRPDRA